MAYMQSARATHLGLADRFATWMKVNRDRKLRRALYNRTFNELASLSNRDLLDMGVHRSMIAEIAHEAAYGK